jgi:hypothetical protein
VVALFLLELLVELLVAAPAAPRCLLARREEFCKSCPTTTGREDRRLVLECLCGAMLSFRPTSSDAMLDMLMSAIPVVL